MKKRIALILTLACLLSVSGCGAGKTTTEKEMEERMMEDGIQARTLAAAVYPEMAPYPNESALDGSFSDAYDAWWRSVRAQRDQPDGYAEGLDSFFSNSIREFLSGTDGENRVYSPLNVYMALAMLAELTDGQSREQIMDLLGTDSIESLRAQARALWNANYRDDGVSKSVLASSLWLNEQVNFVQETMDRLAENYYASSYQGEMGSPEFNRALQEWLNEQTGGLLSEQASGVKMDPLTILALATTIYFKANWTDSFREADTSPDVFHTPESDMTVDFMHESDTSTYFWGDKFSAVGKGLNSNMGSMWFLLPDEGVTPEELLADSQTMNFLLLKNKDEWENKKYLRVNLTVPKFDVVSDLDLIPGLQELGVTDVFDYAVSDFTPMTADTDEVYVSQIEHAARVVIDEEGCLAAAFTVIMMDAGAAMPPDDEIDFRLDRPFLFVITGADGLPLFTGVVNQP